MISFKTQDASNKYGLILNTSNPKTQVGLYHNDNLIARKEAHEPNDHVRDIINYVDQVIKSVPITLQQLDYIAAVVGPGSYTGIRIGIAAAQGFALPFKTKLVALSILEALALQILKHNHQDNAIEGTILISTCFARSDTVYYQVLDQDLQSLVSPSVATHDEIVAMMNDYKVRYRNKKIVIVKDTEVHLETLGWLACYNINKEEHDLAPLYINQPNYRRHNIVRAPLKTEFI